MTTPDRSRWRRAFASLQDRAEEWIYRQNERDHWIFQLYDRGNEGWARLAFRGLRRRAGRLDAPIRASGGLDARVCFLQPEDEQAFAELLGSFDFKYLPPHGLDPASARAALRRSSYLPFGIFVRERLSTVSE